MPRKGANFGVSSASDILAIVCDNARAVGSLIATAEEQCEYETVRE
jgi:hypothetical protein